MACLLRRKFVSLGNLSPSSRHHNLIILTPLYHFSIHIDQKQDVPFMAQYLISSFGFSEERALKVASGKNLSPIKTPDRPESVVRFLKNAGLTDVQIKKAICLAPNLLAKSVSKTLEPCARELIDGGFTRETLIQLIQYNPMALTRNNLVSRLQFWRNFVGSEEVFLKYIKKWGFPQLDIEDKVIPKINLLRECGLSNQQITYISMRSSHFLIQDPDTIKSNFAQIEKLGFLHGSKMFLVALVVYSSLKKETLESKVAFFKTTYGWSQEDINLALKKFPRILVFSQENISTTMDFLLKKEGLDPRSIALRPRILSCSLERRLIPRHYVLTMLKSKGLEINWNIFTAATQSEKSFIEKYILPYKEELPDLAEAYAVACAGKLPLS